MSWRWSFTEKSAGQFKKLDRLIRKRIVNKLDLWCKYEKPLKFAESLVNSELGSYRFRVGDYRIIIDVEENMIIVLAVGHRREIYK
jgi:mRNA interferase RelE/StbE